MPTQEFNHGDRSRISVSCQNCGLFLICLPGGLNTIDLKLLDTIIKCRRPIKRNEVLFRTGEPFQFVYAIQSGSVKTTILTEDGREQVTGFHFPGELLGLDAISPGHHSHTARSLERTRICEVPFRRFEALAQRLPKLQSQMLRIMSNQIGYIQNLSMPLRRNSTKAKLAIFLLNLSERLRQRGFSDTEYHLSMSRNDIANYLGVAVETVCRLFTLLQEEGVLWIQRRHIYFLDLPLLRNIAGLPRVNTDHP